MKVRFCAAECAQVPSNGLTAIRSPEGMDATLVVSALRKEHGMRITAGQEPMKSKLIRIGHMGFYRDADILDVVGALEGVCRAQGWTQRSGAREAAEAILSAQPGSRSSARAAS